MESGSLKVFYGWPGDTSAGKRLSGAGGLYLFQLRPQEISSHRIPNWDAGSQMLLPNFSFLTIIHLMGSLGVSEFVLSP